MRYPIKNIIYEKLIENNNKTDLELLKEWCKEEELDVWAYCLMTNHVHLIISPGNHSNMSRAIGEVHRRYTRMINFREKWRGYLWQGRFSSFPMEENGLLKAVAYVELNPVKAGMVDSAWDYPWSSVHAHLSGSDKLGLVNTDTHILLGFKEAQLHTYEYHYQ